MAGTAKTIDKTGRTRIRKQLASGQRRQWENGLRKLERLGFRPDASMVRSLRAALEGPDEWRRERTLCALAEVAVPGCFSAAVRLLDHKDWTIRDFACQALGTMRLPAARPHVRRRLTDVDEQVRYSAVEALTWSAHDLTLKELQALLADPSEMVRLVVVQALVHYSYCPRDRSPVVGHILSTHARRERAGLVRCDLLEWSYSRTHSIIALRKLAKLMTSGRGIVRWRAYDSVPDRLRPDHAAWMLRVIRRRLRCERFANVKDLLTRVERRLTTASAPAPPSAAASNRRAR